MISLHLKKVNIKFYITMKKKLYKLKRKKIMEIKKETKFL